MSFLINGRRERLVSILRNKTQGNFTLVNNRILKDKNLSLKERGMLITIISLPDNWSFTSKGLCEILPEGIDAINSTLKSLIKKGYLKRYRERNEAGLLGENIIEIIEDPEVNHPELENPNMDNPSMENPNMDKPVLDLPNLDVPALEEPSEDNPEQYNTYENKELNKYNTNHINHSFSARDDSEETRAHNHEMLANNLHYDERAFTQNPHDFAIFKSLYKVLLDFVNEPPKNEYVRVANKNRLYEEVKNTFLNMTNDQMNYAIARLREVDLSKIVAFTPYALTMLYNATQTPREIKPVSKEKGAFLQMEQQDYDFKAIEKALCR